MPLDVPGQVSISLLALSTALFEPRAPCGLRTGESAIEYETGHRLRGVRALPDAAPTFLLARCHPVFYVYFDIDFYA